MSDDIDVSHPLPAVEVGGFRTVAVTRRELASLMAADCLSARSHRASWTPKLVFSSNGQGIALAGRDAQFARVMQDADVVHADGMSVVFASKLTSKPLPERISTTDFFHDAAEAAVIHKFKFFLLGSSEEQNAAAAAAIQKLYPGVDVVGRHHGFFSDDDDEEICQIIRDSGADVLWVALGKPRQEEWCVRNRSRLIGVGWVKTCGGLLSFLAGDSPRAPKWMQAAGLEWLFRTMVEPRRLAWRYASTNPYAIYRLFLYTDRSANRWLNS